MSCVVGLLRSRLWPLASMLALATGLAGCSGESTRFNENPFGSKAPADTTASVPQYQAAPVARIESQPLPPAAARPAPVAANHGTVGGGRGLASYTPAAAGSTPYPAVASRPLPPPDVTGSVVPAASQAARPTAGRPMDLGRWYAGHRRARRYRRRHFPPSRRSADGAHACQQHHRTGRALSRPAVGDPSLRRCPGCYSAGSADARCDGGALGDAAGVRAGQRSGGDAGCGSRYTGRARRGAWRDAEQDLPSLRQADRRDRQG